ncbi:MAG TPA: hypothetical protein VEA59_02770 [Patescibacteria group bacterium]|nr:hypothetical protein [Patescibacteria group bacterium]
MRDIGDPAEIVNWVCNALPYIAAFAIAVFFSTGAGDLAYGHNKVGPWVGISMPITMSYVFTVLVALALWCVYWVITVLIQWLGGHQYLPNSDIFTPSVVSAIISLLISSISVARKYQ